MNPFCTAISILCTIVAVSLEGRLGSVQPVADRPEPAGREMTHEYAVGALLLAGSQMAELADSAGNGNQVAATAAIAVVDAAVDAKADSPDYLRIVRAFADAMIEYGRDTYGKEHSPLFAAALDRKTSKVPQGAALRCLLKIPRADWGIRPHDRTLTGANPMQDQNLYQVLYALTELTGEASYAAEADKTLKWFFEHCQSSTTGLMPWGEHMGWDFFTEKPIRNTHEYLRPWVLWDRCYKLAPDACCRFSVGLWKHQIHDQRTGAFSRHAGYAKHSTAPGIEFPRHGGFYIATWAAAYQQNKSPQMIRAIETLVDMYNKLRDKQTDAIPAYSGGRDVYWPPSNLSLAIDLGRVAAKAPQKLAEKMQACAARTDKVFVRTPHDLGPGGNGFVSRGNTSTLAAQEHADPGHFSHSSTWTNAYGDYTDARVALMCLDRYKQVKLDRYQSLAMAAAQRYLNDDPDESKVVWPGAMADAIILMLKMYRMTGNQEYLARADHFARKAVRLFFTDGSPLPKASSKHDHYEAITASDTLAMALLDLWTAKNKPDLDLELVWAER